MKRPHRFRFALAALMILVISVLATGCSGDDGDSADDGYTEADGTATEESPTNGAREPAAAEDAALSEGSAGEGGNPVTALDGDVVLTAGSTADLSGARVIRDAELEVHVAEFEPAWDRIRRIAAAAGGYVADASTDLEVRDDERYAVGTATLRIPSPEFDTVLDEIGDLGESVSQSVTGTDVSEEFVDLEARLRHWTRVEEFTLGLMDDAQDIDDSLAIQQRLDTVQLTIEQIEGRLRFLDARTSFSSIAVSITEAPVVAATAGPAPDPAPISQAFADAVDIIMAALAFIIVALAFALPFSLLGALGFIGYRLVRRNRSRTPTVPAIGPQPES